MIEGAAHFELFPAALHMHDLLAAEVAADLLDRIDANHGRDEMQETVLFGATPWRGALRTDYRADAAVGRVVLHAAAAQVI